MGQSFAHTAAQEAALSSGVLGARSRGWDAAGPVAGDVRVPASAATTEQVLSH